MTTSSSKVSVGVTAYNCEQYLAEAIQSVLDQDQRDLEVVVVIDASPDGCLEIAKSFEPSGVRVIAHPINQGIGAARNTAISAFSGDYFCFLDGDDVWPENHVTLLLAALNGQQGCDLAFGMVEQFISPELSQAAKARLRCPTDIVPAMVAGGMLASRSIYDRVGSYDADLVVGEFVDWFMRVSDAGFSHRVLPDVVLRRRIHGRNHSLANKGHGNGYAQLLKRSLDRKRKAGVIK